MSIDIDDIIQQLRDFEKEVNDKYRALQAQKEELEAKYRDLEINSNARIRDLEQALSTQQAQFQQQVDALKREKTEKQEEIERLKEGNETFVSLLNASHDEVHMVEAQLEACKSELNQKKAIDGSRKRHSDGAIESSEPQYPRSSQMLSVEVQASKVESSELSELKAQMTRSLEAHDLALNELVSQKTEQQEEIERLKEEHGTQNEKIVWIGSK